MSSQIPDEHDPLCHMAGRDPNEVYTFSIPCECETIQRVRADERRKVSEEVERLTRWKADAIEVLDAWKEVWKEVRAKAAELMAGGAS